MADASVQVAPDSTGKKIQTFENTVGGQTVESQAVALVGTDSVPVGFGAAAPASTAVGLTVRQAGDGLMLLNGATVSGTATLATQDTSGGYGWWQLQLQGIFSFTVVVEVSNDNTNWQGVPGSQVQTVISTSTTSNFNISGNLYCGYCKARYVRVRCSAFTSSTSGAVTFVLRSTTPPVEFINVSVTNSLQITGTNAGAGSVAAPVSVVPSGVTAAPGFTSARIASAATTNATSVKASAGNLYSMELSNTSAAVKFFKLYNKATAPTVGTDTPVHTILIPAGATLQLCWDMNPKRFSTGIAYAITGAKADTDATAVAADDVHGSMNYA